jgi:hypothetical protein
MLPLLVALFASTAATEPQPHSKTIVVVGERIDDAAANLKACLARNCKPDEDIDATLALAETQLLDGKYREARTTLLASLRRNKEFGDVYPIPVSDLYRANGKVAASLGFDQDYYRSTFGIYSTLKHGLPSKDARKYMAMIEVAEMMYRTRGHTRARLYYDRIADQAKRDGRDDIAAIARLRSAIRHLPPGSEMQMAEIKRVAGLQGDKMRAPILEAKLALARIAYQKNDEAGAKAIVDDLTRLNIKRPILIYQPSYAMVARELDSGSEFAFPFQPAPAIGGAPNESGGPGGGPSAPSGGDPGGVQNGSRAAVTSTLQLMQWSTTKRLPGNFDDMWADITFRITPEGKVSDLKIVRSKGNLYWTKPLLLSMAGRRYTPGSPHDPSSVRTERYTYTSGYEVQTGARTAVHSPKARVEMIDLSDIGSPQ